MCVSLMGDGIFLVAMAWQVYALSNAPTALALVGIAMTVPTIAFLLLGGVVSDRARPPAGDARRRRRARDRRRRCSRSCRSPGCSSCGTSSRSWPCTARAPRSSARPSTRSSPTSCPPPSSPQANSLDQFVRPVALRLAGPALGGVLIDAVGVGTAFALRRRVVRDLGVIALVAMRARVPRGRGRGPGVRAVADIRTGLVVRPPPRLAVGDVRHRRGRLPAVHGPGRGAAALPRQERARRPRGRPRARLRGGRDRLGRLRRRAGPARAAARATSRSCTSRGRSRRSPSPATAWRARSGSSCSRASRSTRSRPPARSCGRRRSSATSRPPCSGACRASTGSISIGLLPVSFALTGPVSAAIGAQTTLVAAGLIGGAVTFAALLLPGMRAVEGLGAGADDHGVDGETVAPAAA